MDVSPNIAGRIERRLEALGLGPEDVDLKVGLRSGTTERLRRVEGFLPGGRFLRGLCAALDTDEEYLLGLEPGDLIPAELLVEPQGELGLLSPFTLERVCARSVCWLTKGWLMPRYLCRRRRGQVPGSREAAHTAR